MSCEALSAPRREREPRFARPERLPLGMKADDAFYDPFETGMPRKATTNHDRIPRRLTESSESLRKCALKLGSHRDARLYVFLEISSNGEISSQLVMPNGRAMEEVRACVFAEIALWRFFSEAEATNAVFALDRNGSILWPCLAKAQP
jgi:hypothetical protein